ncbi:MAG: PQQ-binding-like beta-propeller repeat protein [Planctomycetota bacterium]
MKSQNTVGYYVPALFFGLGLSAFVSGSCGTAKAEDWPNWRGPNHNGISSETGWLATWPQEGPKILWKCSIGTGFASMAVSGGRVYATGNIDDNDIVYCLDAVTGDEIWKKSYPCPLFAKSHEGGPCATPTVDGDAVYTFSKNGDAIRFEAATGRVVWHKRLNKELGIKHPTWYFSGSPLVTSDLVVLNAGTYGVALNKADGSVAWQNGKSACGYSTAVPCTLGSQMSVVFAVCKELVGVDPATGKVLWKFPWETDYDINAADAIVSGDMVFISSGYNKGCVLLEVNGGKVTELWANKNMRNQVNSSVLWEGHLYGFDGQVGGGGKLTCLDFKTSRVKWSQAGMGTGSLMLAGGRLIILGEKGKLVIAAASPDGYRELASAQILSGKCWTVPVLANGRIYARNAEGQLVCVDVSAKG